MNVIISDTHVVYTSGRHGSSYVNKDAIFIDPRQVSHLCHMAALEIMEFLPSDLVAERHNFAIVSPAIGGIIISQWVTYHLLETLGVQARALFADKKSSGGFELLRGYDKIVSGKKSIVVGDVLHTGGSVKDTCEAVRTAGGEVIMALAICNRGGVTAEDIGVPYLCSLVNLDLKSWPANECRLCQDGIPLNMSLGHAKNAREKIV